MSRLNELLHGPAGGAADILSGEASPARDEILLELRAALTNALRRIDALESQSAPVASDLLRREAAAEYLGIALATIEKWKQEGYGPAYTNIGRLIMYRVSDLDAWIDSQTVYPNGQRKREKI